MLERGTPTGKCASGRVRAELFDVTYVDDEALFGMHASPLQRVRQIRIMIETVRSTFRKFGFQVNWAKGKTELMAKFRGARAKRARELLFSSLDGLPVVLSGGGIQVIHHILAYKHLGGTVTEDGHMRDEIVNWISAATLALRRFRRPLSLRRLAVESKLALIEFLVFSRLFYGAGGWTELSPWCFGKLHTFYMQALRNATGAGWAGRQPGDKYKSDAEVLRESGCASLECRLQQARLRAATQVLACPLDALRGLLSVRSPRDDRQMSWTRRFEQDLTDLYHAMPDRFREIGPPTKRPQCWVDLIRDHPSEWKQLCGQIFVQRSSSGPASHDKPKGVPAASPCALFSCTQCGAAGFKSQKALSQHERVVHGARCLMNKFVATNRCPCCGLVFADRLRVIAHLSETRQRSKVRKQTCRDTVLQGGIPELDLAVVERLDAEARTQRSAARKAGHTRPVVPWHKRASEAPPPPLFLRPAKRLRGKTTDVEWRWARPQEAAKPSKRPRREG